MTGFGEAHHQDQGLAVAIELRAINNRFFKLSVRATEGYGALEPRIEEAVRRNIRRGTVQLQLRIDRLHRAEDYCINTEVLARYREQLQAVCEQWGVGRSLPVEALLPLPGVVDDRAGIGFDPEEDWSVIQATLEAALANLAHMRTEEGRAMAADLAANCRAIAAGLDQIERRAPRMLDAYRARLEDRLGKILAERQLVLDPSDLIREVALFSERSDISEEIVRLRSHLDQFDATMQLAESSGRKLEFLTQEMFREANTIGSKSNDVEIAKHVIEIKTAIERIREMIQNIE